MTPCEMQLSPRVAQCASLEECAGDASYFSQEVQMCQNIQLCTLQIQSWEWEALYFNSVSLLSLWCSKLPVSSFSSQQWSQPKSHTFSSQGISAVYSVSCCFRKWGPQKTGMLKPKSVCYPHCFIKHPLQIGTHRSNETPLVSCAKVCDFNI